MDKKPRTPKWKKLARHPLSSEYRDLEGADFDALQASIKNHGYNRAKPIYTFEGKVIDGWQRQTACHLLHTEGQFEGKPAYKKLVLPIGMSPREWVEQQNDRRRHETPAETRKRADDRRKRVLRLRNEEGWSLRRLAREFGVTHTQILRDLEDWGGTSVPIMREEDEPEKGLWIEKPKEPKTKKKIVRPCDDCKRMGKRPSCQWCPKIEKAGAFEWSGFMDTLGPVKRRLEALAAERAGKAQGEYDTCLNMLNDFQKTVEEWHGKKKMVGK